MAHENGYPALTDIEDYLSDEGLEDITLGNTNYKQEFLELIWGILNRTSFAGALGVYLPSSTTFNVRGGKYLYKGVVKTFTTGEAINPTDNDTTYIWLTPSNTIDSAIDGTGWPATEHIKLAEIDVDSDGIITEVRDLRGQSFLPYIGQYVVESDSSAELVPVHWDSASPADDDEARLPVYAENDAGEKIEYCRRSIILSDVSDGSEDAGYKISLMTAGTLTELFQLTSTGLHLTNKSADATTQGLSIHWDSTSPADDDELHIPLYAENDADEKIEFGRLVLKLTDVSDGSEDAEMSLSLMTGGSLTSLGKIVCDTATQTLTNKTLTSPVINTPAIKRTIEAHTSADTLTEAETGSVHTNLGATAAVTLTLPASAAAGTEFTFAVQAAYELRIDPGTATIRDDSGQTADKYKSADAIGECITLIADANGDWAVVAKSGTWTEEA